MSKLYAALAFIFRAPLLFMLQASSLSNAFRDGAIAKVCGTAAGRYKAAFYGATNTPTVATAAYTATGEIAASTNYPTGGVTLAAATLTATTMTIPDFTITTGASETIGPVSAILVYDTTDSNKVVAFLDYTGAPKTASNTGTFLIDFPAAMITMSVS